MRSILIISIIQTQVQTKQTPRRTQKMSCINILQQFLSHLPAHPRQSSSWQTPLFVKSSTDTLSQMALLQSKIQQLQTFISRNRLRNSPEQQSKMLHNLKENIKACENRLNRLKGMEVDMKGSDREFLKQYKASVLTTLQMKMLENGRNFKKVFEETKKGRVKEEVKKQENVPNLSRPLFIQQSQQEIMQEIAVNEFKDIEKSFGQILDMYKQTSSMVRSHQLLVQSIQSSVNETDLNVEQGRKHLVKAHQRESKNRPFIIKIFAMLYFVSGVYIVFLS